MPVPRRMAAHPDISGSPVSPIREIPWSAFGYGLGPLERDGLILRARRTSLYSNAVVLWHERQRKSFCALRFHMFFDGPARDEDLQQIDNSCPCCAGPQQKEEREGDVGSKALSVVFSSSGSAADTPADGPTTLSLHETGRPHHRIGPAPSPPPGRQAGTRASARATAGPTVDSGRASCFVLGGGD